MPELGNQRYLKRCRVILVCRWAIMNVSMKILSLGNNMMNQRNELIQRLSGVTTSELQDLVRMLEKRRLPTTPRRSVRELIQHFEANPILHYTQPPVPPPRRRRIVQLTQNRKALRGHIMFVWFLIEIHWYSYKNQDFPLVKSLLLY